MFIGAWGYVLEVRALVAHAHALVAHAHALVGTVLMRLTSSLCSGVYLPLLLASSSSRLNTGRLGGVPDGGLWRGASPPLDREVPDSALHFVIVDRVQGY